MEILALKEKTRKMLTPSRFEHTEGVLSEVERIAKACGADLDKAKIAALLHDITKKYTQEEHVELCRENGVTLTEIEKNEPKLLHQITGAIVAKQEFSIDDEEILSAIRYHTTAKPNMTPLEKTLYLADFTEPGRTYEGVDMLRQVIYSDIEDGLLAALDFSIQEILGKGALLHPDTIDARNDILLRRKNIGK